MLKIKKSGGTIVGAVFWFDRLEDGVEVMEKLNIPYHSATSLDEYAWDYLVKNKTISRDFYNQVRKRMEDKDAWARNMLSSEKGTKEFMEVMKRDPERAQKILDVGYPEIKDELLDRIKSITP